MTSKQARDKLSTMKRGAKQSLHELSLEVERLVGIAYPRQNYTFQLETNLDIFSRTLNHRTLQQHLLARPHDTLLEAVEIAEEFLNLEGPRTTITTLQSDPSTSPNSEVSEVQALVEIVQELLKTQQELLQQIKTQTKARTIPKTTSKPPGPCYGCGETTGGETVS